ncbi:MAG: methionyl-tRNA formyltransferase [Sedimenticolaceae bacterium]|jgi:methionyl-tRNA formyltransferase
MTDSKRIIFAGTPDFSVPPLRALLASAHRVVAVYTQPDRPSGRGRKLSPSPVKELALDAGIPVYQPVNFKDPGAVRELQSLGADLMVVVAYGLLLPKSVLDAPRLGCVNIHASVLPRWRGAAPIQRAVLAGDGISGVTIMRMEEGLDTGPMFLIEEVPLAADETGGSLHDRLSVLGAEALMQALPGILDGSLVPEPQDESQTCYARKLDKSEAVIDWTRAASDIERQVRAFNPWPVAQTRFEDANLRIWRAQAISGIGGAPGTVMNAARGGIDVATGKGLLRITELQLPGKRAMGAQDFINANSIQGTVLG